MGGCESIPEEEVYEYPRRRYHRPRTPIIYSRPQPRLIPVGPYRPLMAPTIMPSYPERRFPLQHPVYSSGYRRFDDDFDDYYDDFYDRGRGRYSYHSYTR